ncbi:dTDP-4-dehydrorhamnose reductase family protein [Thalassotalea mangrovi]|uniref:dTDP-4-dehydrorhamnose reductase n=1 Tax=Thalassotalea mangrovi TaxID=2572245 RepID=A0A4U1B6Q1_9GAMM|nr:SDR family oxidoreductase [Thalassotalea mangrovi]TKB46138.1 SDR family oxidoreductase [Thalassotalea mangrovi]
MKVLIIGATGMLGYSLFSNLSENNTLDVWGTVRNIDGKERYFRGREKKLIHGVDISNIENLKAVINQLKPNFVLNCIGLIKQYKESKSPVAAISINSLFPHQLASMCDQAGSKLIHFSTDCVFSGNKGAYTEESTPDAKDVYGRSKLLGEVDYAPHLTLRTSIIGHELSSNVSLVDWFLTQSGKVKGFSKAIFSGLPTCYIAKILSESVFHLPELSGLYHLSVDPIDKYSLLQKVSDEYEKEIEIEESDELVIDRSLSSKRFQDATGFKAPSWDHLLKEMHQDFLKYHKS